MKEDQIRVGLGLSFNATGVAHPALGDTGSLLDCGWEGDALTECRRFGRSYPVEAERTS